MKAFRVICAILFAAVLVCCNDKKSKPAVDTSSSSNTLNNLKESVIEELRKTNEPELLLRDSADRFVLFFKNLNGRKTAIITLTHSQVFLFSEINGRWEQTDSFSFNDYASSFYTEHLNGDTCLDLVLAGMDELKGDYIPYVFISDSQGLLHHRPEIRLKNPEYDTKTGMIKSSSVAVNLKRQFKELYFWQNDTLKLLRGAELSMAGKTPEVTFYRLQNGLRADLLKIKDKTGEIYDTAIWADDF